MIPLLLAAAATLSAPTLAQDCDAPALAEAIEAASPIQVASLYVQLAQCDAGAALKLSATELARAVPDDDGDQAAIAAVNVGATDALLSWMDGMNPRDRSRTIAALGAACNTQSAVKDFLVGSQDRLGDRFWEERWYRALANCGGPETGAILAAELDRGAGADKTRFFGVLETYARSQGAAAIPKLVELAGGVSDVESLTYIVQAFPDAARVGAAEGTNLDGAAAASAAIVGLAPSLPPKVIEAARVALQSLGDEAGADALAGERFRDVRQDDGNFLWGVLLTETAQCKKGTETWRRLHHALIHEGGQTWPDQLRDKVATAAETGWELTLGHKCKAEPTLVYTITAEPFADEAAYQKWRDEQLAEAAKTPVGKSWTIREDPLHL
ncbi:MAG: hypothetical protein GXP62_02045 [Oligoflexia bacterium]|nr:hypothetical protein [Oligoflexia bacterium]